MPGAKKREPVKKSVRRSVIITLVVCFVIIFTLLCVAVSIGMQSMLSDREQEYMFGQAEMARNMLLVSMEPLPILAQEWAEMPDT